MRVRHPRRKNPEIWGWKEHTHTKVSWGSKLYVPEICYVLWSEVISWCPQSTFRIYNLQKCHLFPTSSSVCINCNCVCRATQKQMHAVHYQTWREWGRLSNWILICPRQSCWTTSEEHFMEIVLETPLDYSQNSWPRGRPWQ